VLPYDFAGYEAVKENVAEILFRYEGEYDGRVNQVSCDESYMELFLPIRDSSSETKEAEKVAQSLRREVFEATECTASIGVAKNMFLAKVRLFVRAWRPSFFTFIPTWSFLLFIYRVACY
jgi:DNA repair protein REV1